MKTKLFTFAAFIAFLSLFASCGGSSSVDKDLQKTVAIINKTIPKEVAPNINFDGAEALPKKIKYNFSLLNMEENDIDVDQFADMMQEQLVLMIKNSSSSYKKDKITTVISFKDSNGKVISEVTVKPEDY